jgi:hypothetical protein
VRRRFDVDDDHAQVDGRWRAVSPAIWFLITIKYTLLIMRVYTTVEYVSHCTTNYHIKINCNGMHLPGYGNSLMQSEI